MEFKSQLLESAVNRIHAADDLIMLLKNRNELPINHNPNVYISADNDSRVKGKLNKIDYDLRKKTYNGFDNKYLQTIALMDDIVYSDEHKEVVIMSDNNHCNQRIIMGLNDMKPYLMKEPKHYTETLKECFKDKKSYFKYLEETTTVLYSYEYKKNIPSDITINIAKYIEGLKKYNGEYDIYLIPKYKLDLRIKNEVLANCTVKSRIEDGVPVITLITHSLTGDKYYVPHRFDFYGDEVKTLLGNKNVPLELKTKILTELEKLV